MKDSLAVTALRIFARKLSSSSAKQDQEIEKAIRAMSRQASRHDAAQSLRNALYPKPPDANPDRS